jgi:hypothetical protein
MLTMVSAADSQIIEPWIVGVAVIVFGVVLFIVLAIITQHGQDD